MQALRVLLLEDWPDDAELIVESLREGGLPVDPHHVSDRAGFERALQEPLWHLILLDYALPDFDGIAALELARERHPTVPIVFITGELPEATALELLKLGATDYVMKDRLERLAPIVFRAERERREREELLAEVEQQLQNAEAALTRRIQAGHNEVPVAEVRQLLAPIGAAVRRGR